MGLYRSFNKNKNTWWAHESNCRCELWRSHDLEHRHASWDLASRCLIKISFVSMTMVIWQICTLSDKHRKNFRAEAIHPGGLLGTDAGTFLKRSMSSAYSIWVIRSWLPSSRKMKSYWRESSGGLQGWWGDWSISPTRRGWGNWAFSAWRREGWEGTL